VQTHRLDETDIDILRILFNDCRTSYRSIGLSVGLSTNAVKARIKRMLSTGVIQDFSTVINPAAFRYSKLCHLTVRDSKTLRETLNRLKLLGEPVMKLDCIGGISVIVLAIREQEEEKIQLLSETLKPAIVQKCFVGQSTHTRQKLRETDFKILECLIFNPRVEISEIARRISVSSKTVSSRLEKMKENKMLHFIVRTDPASMQGYIRFAMFIRMERKGSQKLIRQIQEELEKSFVIAFPMIIQEDVTSWQLVARNIFEIDPVLKKIELLEGVTGADVYIPFRREHYTDWMLREIDSRIRVKE
jgi:Lrp/AsnC family transcriptional regulator for asnA, asnC and gidA